MEDNRKKIFVIIGIIFLILLMTIGSLVFFKVRIENMTKVLDEGEYEEYDKYYAMIVKDRDLELWKLVYDGARQEAQENGVYVELLGNNLSAEYTRDELMEIAILSKVDGIIVEADESTRMTELIDEAVAQNIPVVTVLGDNTASQRQSFVGVGSYNLGREYGRQVMDLCGIDSKNVLILFSGNTDGTSQHLFFSGIQETIDNEMPVDAKAHLEIKFIENESTFSTEEAIRDIFMNSEVLPDIIVCMDEQSTVCVYQAVVDYNKVGDIDIIGYYDSPSILQAIERKVIHTTVSIDARQMGMFCAEALNEYNELGNVNAYFSVDVTVIHAGNVKDYIGEDE